LPEAQSEYYLGNLLLHQGRLDEAETHLQKSSQADTQFTSGQLAFSALRLRQRKPEEAKKYLPEITSREPNNYLGHFYTGQIALSEEKPEAAITSFRQAVKLKPDLAFLHAELGIALSNAGLEQEAATSFEQAARLDPDNSALYRTGSLTFLNLARGDKAARFAKLYLAREGWHATSSAYMAFVAYFGYRQMKSSAAAEEMLKSLVEKGDTQSWPYPVVQYLQRQLSAEQLLKLAKDNDELTEAHAYLGMDLSLAGNREEALTHLYWVRDHGNKGFTEYPMSLAEIKRLESKGK
ncbi:MAG: tetratricopeptide repeat protein, partial [Blastocatellia bacterium]